MTWTDNGFEAVAQLVGSRTGLVLASRSDSAEQGMRRAMVRARVTDLDRYLVLLQTQDSILDDLVVELTVGETYFFRESAQFDFLRREVLPSLRPRCEQGHVIRAWSAGCASGEEAYSLAILLTQEGLADKAHLLATDISRAALARARQAVYGAWSLRGENAAAALPYLRREGNLYRLDQTIRQRVRFAYLNLALDVYPSLLTATWEMDIIICRNVLIYFDRQTVRRVAQRLFASLAEGGWLLTASSDPPLADDAPFEAVVTGEGVFYRKSQSDRRGQRTESSAREPSPSWQTGGGIQAENNSEWPPAQDTPQPQPTAQLSSSVPDLTASGSEAQAAFERGDYARVVELARSQSEESATSALLVRALANLNTADAERACADAANRFPLSAELHYLRAVLLVELGRDREAIQAIRRVLYLDPSLAVAHFTLGAVLSRCGDLPGARRAYRNTRDLCAASPADQPLPLADGEPAGRLAEAASAQMDLLDAEGRML